MTHENDLVDATPGWLRATPDGPCDLSDFEASARPARSGWVRSVAVVLAAALLIGGIVLFVAPPGWLGSSRPEKPLVTEAEPTWVATTQTQLNGVDEQLALIEHATAQYHRKAPPARPSSSGPPPELDRLAQREAALRADRDALDAKLAAYRKANELRAGTQRDRLNGREREAHDRALAAAEAELAAARDAPAPDLSWEPTNTAVRDLHRLLSRPEPGAAGPSAEGSPSARQTAPLWSTIPVPGVPGVLPTAPTPDDTLPLPRPTAPDPTVRAHRSAAPSAPAAPPTRSAPSGGLAGQTQPPTPVPGSTAPVVPSVPSRANNQPAAPAPAPSSRPGSGSSEPSSGSSSQRSSGSPSPRRLPTEQEVRDATGDDEIARMSQTPEGQALMRELFGGGG